MIALSSLVPRRPRLSHAFGPERILEKFADFAAAFTHQRHHHDIEGVGARQHGEKRRLADTGTGEHAETLANAERGENVDDADAGAKMLADAGAHHRGTATGRCIAGFGGDQRTVTIDRLANGVDHPAEPAFIRPRMHGPLVQHDIVDRQGMRDIAGRDQDPRRLDLDDFAARRLRALANRDEIAESRVAGHAFRDDDIGIDRRHRAAPQQGLRRNIRRQHGMAQANQCVHAGQVLWKALIS